MMKEVIYFNDDGDEITVKLPHKMEVCHRCDGHGSHLTPSIGNHAYSQEEFNEAFHDEEDREQYFKRGGIYDVVCEECCGNNVVPVVDEEACQTPELKEHLKLYLAWQEAKAQDEAEDRKTRWYEDGCPMD